MTETLNRRAALAALALVAAGFASAQQGATVRIGYQKSSTLIAVLKAQGTLERQLAPLGVRPA